jgi:phosphoribosylamine--glycine ligase
MAKRELFPVIFNVSAIFATHYYSATNTAMRILLLGSGGREHALAWKISQSPLCEGLFIAPGNAGTSVCGTNLPFKVTDFESIREACIEKKIDVVIVGPEEPLVKGVTDYIINDDTLKHVHVIGPTKDGAVLEGSKAFAKSFMQRYNIPTAEYKEFSEENYEEGISYIMNHDLPVVIKADGLAAGKGVVICENHLEAIAEYELMIQMAKFGDAGKRVVVEQFLRGIEISVFVLTDGKNYVLLPEAKDYKRIGEGDTGPNTGGMGAVSPVPFADDVLKKKIRERIIEPTIEGLQKDGIEYRGFVFFGLMIVQDEPYVIEYNCRMGDPETEVVIPRLKTDLVQILYAASRQELNTITIETERRTACTIVAVSGGYPGEYNKGYEIKGLEDVNPADSIVFHMGTALEKDRVVTNGGRVFCVTSYGMSIFDAVEISKEEIEKISFTGMEYRGDIGYEFE